MATVITELAALFSNLGLSNILIQKRRINRLQIDTIFWTSVTLSTILAVAVILLSFVAAALFREELVAEILMVMSVTFVVSSLTTISSVVIGRLMWFSADFWIQLCTVLGRAGAAIGAAMYGMGVWSLVVGALAGTVVQMTLSFVAVPYRPRLRFHARFIKESWRTSGSYFLGGVLYFVNANMDVTMIGRWLGAIQLGLYQNARSLTDEVRARIATPIQNVLFPAFASLQGDKERLGEAVKRSTRLLSAIVIPVGVGVGCVAKELVPVLYGPQWQGMIPVVEALGISVALKASTSIAAPILFACDRVGVALRINSLGTALVFLSLLVAVPFGIEVAAVVLACLSTYWFVALNAAFREVGLRFRDVVELFWPPVVAAALMFLAVELIRRFAMFDATDAWRLVANVGLGAVSYGVVLTTLSREHLRELLGLLRSVRQRG